MRTISRNTILFDWDGTLFDSASAGWLAFQKTFDDLGVLFTREFYEAHYSPNWYTMYETLSVPKEKWKIADELWLERYGEQPPKLVDGARETLVTEVGTLVEDQECPGAIREVHDVGRHTANHVPGALHSADRGTT